MSKQVRSLRGTLELKTQQGVAVTDTIRGPSSNNTDTSISYQNLVGNWSEDSKGRHSTHFKTGKEVNEVSHPQLYSTIYTPENLFYGRS